MRTEIDRQQDGRRIEENGHDDDTGVDSSERERARRERRKKKKADRHNRKDRHRDEQEDEYMRSEDTYGSPSSPPHKPQGGYHQPPPRQSVSMHNPQHPHQHHYPPQHQQQQQFHDSAPPSTSAHMPQQRTMVLSMAFTDQQTGQRGTYTGQVNSLSHKPDGKGTVYYADGSISEGTWMNGRLVESGGNSHMGNNNGGNLGSLLIPSKRVGGGGAVGSWGSGGSPSSSQQDPRTRPVVPSQQDQFDGSGLRARSHVSARTGSGYHQQMQPQQQFGGGNLDKLDRLKSSNKSRNRGASASVQSFNSRGSVDVPSGSASIQLDYGRDQQRISDFNSNFNAGGSQGGGHGGGFIGGAVGGGRGDYPRRNSGYQRQQTQER